MRYQKLDATLIEQIDYSYDVLGRRTSKTLLNAANAPETPMAASYDNANRMSSITLEPGTAQEKRYSLSYDDNGALILKQRVDSAGTPLTQSPTDTTQYSWDSRGRLSQIKHGSATPTTVASYSYDHAGRRISRSIEDVANSASQVSTQYLYNGAQAIGEVRDGQLAASLVTGLGIDDAIARITSAGGTPEVKSYLTDALGSVIAQLKQDQSVEVGYAYSPYGQTLKAGAESGNTSTANATQYTGRENDGAQGGTGGGELYYYRARYYDPVLKRFISQDPIGLAGGLNRYAYADGAPTMYTDPLGLWSATVGAYVGVGGQMTFGNDGGNGFMTARFGFGLGGGASYSPTGGVPGPAPQDPTSGGVVLSCSAKANFNAGPLSASLEKGVARNYSNAESATYGGASASGRDRFTGLGASGSVGGQITIYSGRK